MKEILGWTDELHLYDFMTTQAEEIAGTTSTRYSWLQSKTKDIVDVKIYSTVRHEDCSYEEHRKFIYLFIESLCFL